MLSQKYFFNREILNLILFENETYTYFNSLGIHTFIPENNSCFDYKKITSFLQELYKYEIIGKKYTEENIKKFADKIILILREYRHDLEKNFDNPNYTNFHCYRSIINKFYEIKPIIQKVLLNKNLLFILNQENYNKFYDYVSKGIDFFNKKNTKNFSVEFNKKIVIFSEFFNSTQIFYDDFIKNHEYIYNTKKNLKKNLMSFNIQKIVVKKCDYFFVLKEKSLENLVNTIINEKSLLNKKKQILDFFQIFFGFLYYFKFIFSHNYININMVENIKNFEYLTIVENEYYKDIEKYKNLEKLEKIKDEKTDSDKKCCVCTVNQSIIAFSCGHKHTCAECSLTIIDTTNKCPQCRKDIESFLRIFD